MARVNECVLSAVEVSTSVQTMGPTDNGAWALAFILEVLGIPANPAIIRHRSGAKFKMDATDVVRATKHFSVKSDLITICLFNARATQRRNLFQKKAFTNYGLGKLFLLRGARGLSAGFLNLMSAGFYQLSKNTV